MQNVAKKNKNNLHRLNLDDSVTTLHRKPLHNKPSELKKHIKRIDKL
jgi:hypothetical protein